MWGEIKLKKENISSFIKNYATIIFFVCFCVVISIIEPKFIQINNILNVLRQTSVNAFIAAGMTLVILSGGIDLSVGSIFALSASLGALAMVNGMGFFVAILITLIVGVIIGVANGLLVGVLKIQAFIATLITMTFARGLTYIVTNGIPVTMSSSIKGINFYDFIGGGYLFKIPFPVILMALLYAFLFGLLNKTRFGRYVYATGGNEKAATLAGIKTVPIKIIIYAICGITTSISALVLTSRLGSAPPTAGVGYELDAIAAVVLGGTSLSGGRGSIIKTVLGALIISTLGNALNILEVSSYYQMLIKAIVILFAVVGNKK